MNPNEDDFLKRLRATFSVEAEEHVQAMATGVLELEKSPASDAQQRLVETVFRAAHSLKGAARAVDLNEIETLCGSLEDTFAAWKRRESAPTSDALDTVHRILDAIRTAMTVPGAASKTASESDQSSIPSGAISVSAEAVAMIPAMAETSASSQETVRIAVTKLDARVLEAEEMLTAKLTTSRRAEELRALANRFGTWKKEWTAVEPEARALRQAMDRSTTGGDVQPRTPSWARLLAFLDSNLDHLESLESSAIALTKTAAEDRQAIGKLVDDLLESSKKLLLLPFATLAAPFPKLVRDLCRDQGKEADLVVHGEEVEIDKRILEKMKDPVTHLLRNAVDHGVEKPEDRLRLGKPTRATIVLAASRVNGNKVQLLVSDDGAGIDVDKVRESAVQHGLLSTDEAPQLGGVDAQRLIFESEVSTSPIITRLSG